eukprot:UN31318
MGDIKQIIMPNPHLFDSDVLPDVYDRLSIVDQPFSMVAKQLNNKITIPPRIKGNKEPPEKSALIKPPTIRQIRQSFSVSPLLDLTFPWGHVYNNNRIGCLVPTVFPDNEHQWEAIHASWGPLCDILIWVVSTENSDIPDEMFGGVVLKIELRRSGRKEDNNVWEKVWRMWLHLASTPLINEA